MATHRAPRPRLRRIAGALGIALLAAGPLLGLTSTAVAQGESSGKLRLGHLSPDTPEVDMYLSGPAADGSATAPLAKGAGYGAVTPYRDLPAGRYVVSVRPAGAPADSAPALTTGVEVGAGSVQSLLFFDNGPGGAVQGQVLSDDLSPVAVDSGVVRIVQGADVADPVEVQAAGGPRLATDLRYGTATNYATVPAGRWNVAINAGQRNIRAALDVVGGSVSTMVITQSADGQLAVNPVLDMAGSGAQVAPTLAAPVPLGPPAGTEEEPAAAPRTPRGGVPAGGGAMAGSASAAPIALTLAGALLLVYATSVGKVLRRRRTG